jgi:hypothetical protein
MKKLATKKIAGNSARPKIRRVVIDNMTPGRFRQWLVREGACDEALEWLDGRDLKTAWAEAPRGVWLGWLVAVWAEKEEISANLVKRIMKETGGCLIFESYIATSDAMLKIMRERIEVR